jgi:hypothetical protein
VTGHRRLASADPGLLRSRLTEVLTAAAGTAKAQPWLATSLAEGADRLAAEVALELGYRLCCPLPFAAPEYERDFADPESLAGFRHLLASASLVTSVSLPAGAVREAGYTEAGRAVLTGSRALLALWDGQPARGEGGTGQMVAEALAQGLPVIWLPVEPPHALQVRLPGAGWQPATPEGLKGALARR